jgi:hypothetical protein
VDRPRHQLLARAGLAAEQDRGQAAGERTDRLVNLDHLRVPSDHMLVGRDREVGITRLEHGAPARSLRDAAAHHVVDVIEIQRLQQEVEGAVADGVDRGLHGGVPGEQDHIGGGRAGLELSEQVEAVHLRHHDIGEDDVGGDVGEAAQRLPAVARGDDAMAHGGHVALERDAVRLVVIHDENADSLGSRVRYPIRH